jgi:hypothetical protein
MTCADFFHQLQLSRQQEGRSQVFNMRAERRSLRALADVKRATRNSFLRSVFSGSTPLTEIACGQVQSRMETRKGYFTLEKNIVNVRVGPEMELKLGFPRGHLAHGARVLALVRQPLPGEFVFAGSTLYPGAEGLVDVKRRENVPVPGAWLGQRLVKVVPLVDSGGKYPGADVPVEQWELLVPVEVAELCTLATGQVYWPRR